MSQAPERAAREEVVAAARELHRRHLSVATTGNVSRRWHDGVLITPTAMDYAALTPDDIVFLAADRTQAVGARAPSSEWRFHLAAYRTRPDRQAVVHCHATHATILACAQREIPPFHYMVAAAGGRDIPCVPYAGFGTDTLGALVAGGLRERDACLLAHHGLVTLGTSLEAALDLAEIVEELARVYHGLRQLGDVRLLDNEQIDDAIARMTAYRAGTLERPGV